MGTNQSTFNTRRGVGVAGMRANQEPENVISRTVETASPGIAFGAPAFRGSDDHGCIAGTTQAGTAVGAAAATGNVGTGAITAAPAVAAGAKAGRYTIILLATSATAAFAMTDPEGVIVGHGNVATAATIDGIGPFTIANAGTMTIGDTYYIDVTFTANAALLGVVVLDPSVPADATNPDYVPNLRTASIVTQGVVWVTAGASVADGDQAYWNPATGRYTNTTTHLKLNGCFFDTSGANGDLVRLAIRERLTQR